MGRPGRSSRRCLAIATRTAASATRWSPTCAARPASRRHPVRAARLRGLPARAGFQPGPGSVLTLALAAAVHAGGVTDDAWLDRATDWCWRAIETADPPSGYWV